MPEKSRGRDDGQFGLHPGKQGPLQPDQRALRRGGQRQPDQQRRHPGTVLPDQYVVDEHLEHRWNGHARNDQCQRREGGEGEWFPCLPETGTQAAHQVRPGAAPAELGTRYETEARAREAFVELLQGESARSFTRVVDIDVIALNPLKHDEMVVLPENDHREG